MGEIRDDIHVLGRMAVVMSGMHLVMNYSGGGGVTGSPHILPLVLFCHLDVCSIRF